MGYIGRSMSINAFKAYQKGLLPKSKITKKSLVDEGWNYSCSFFYWLCKESYLSAAEIHHTTPVYKYTNFYHVKESVRYALKNLDLESLYKLYLKKCTKQDILKKKGIKYVKILVKVPIYKKEIEAYLDCIQYNNLLFCSKDICFKVNTKKVKIIQQYEFGEFRDWHNKNRKTIERQIYMRKCFYRNPR